MTYTKEDFSSTSRPLAQTLIDYATQEGAAYGITDAAVAITAVNRQKTGVDKGDVTESSSGLSYSVKISLYAGDRTLTFSQNNIDPGALKSAMLKNMQAIHLVPETPNSRLLESDKVFKGSVPNLDNYDPTPPSPEQLTSYARELEAGALSQDGIKATRSVSITKVDSFLLIQGTNGADILEEKTRYQAMAQVVAANQSGMQIDADYSVASHFNDMAKPRELGISAAQRALGKLDATLPDTGVVPIVLSHDAAEEFFSSVLEALDGSSLYSGTTFLKKSLGKQVLSSDITIIDDPLIPRASDSSPVDSSGQKSEPVTFIQNGVLKQFNVDLLAARQLGVDPIGRNDGTTNVSVLPGTASVEELIGDIKDGIYIRSFKGGTADTNNGTFSRPATGTLIKDGKVTGQAVDGFIVSGNLKEMFMKVAIANDTPAHPNTRYTIAAPTTRINGMTIAGK